MTTTTASTPYAQHREQDQAGEESVTFGRNLFGQELSTRGAFNDGTRIDYVTGSSYTQLRQLKTRVLGEDGRIIQPAEEAAPGIRHTARATRERARCAP